MQSSDGVDWQKKGEIMHFIEWNKGDQKKRVHGMAHSVTVPSGCMSTTNARQQKEPFFEHTNNNQNIAISGN